MALTLLRVQLADGAATAVFRGDDGDEVAFAFTLESHGDAPSARAEDVFTEAYLAVPGPDVPMAHELTRLIGALLVVRASPLPSGQALADAWAEVGDELEHDWSQQQDS